MKTYTMEDITLTHLYDIINELKKDNIKKDNIINEAIKRIELLEKKQFKPTKTTTKRQKMNDLISLLESQKR